MSKLLLRAQPLPIPRFLPSFAVILPVVLCLGGCGMDLAALGLGSGSLSNLSQAVRSGDCAIEDDQADSFLPRLTQVLEGPVSVVVDSKFTVSEREMIERAADSWNYWGRGALGHDIFEITTGSLSDDSTPVSGDDPCSFEVPVSGGGFAIRRGMKESSWNSFGLGDSNPAATLRCRQGDALTRQVMVIQAEWLDSRQFESVVLHEFGHSLGLDHSCQDDGGSDDGFASCADLPSGHDYRSAVMYPSLKSRMSTISEADGSVVIAPEIREQLTGNDSDRASCLFLFDQEGGAFSAARSSGESE